MLNTAMRFMAELDKAGLKYKDTRDTDDGKSIVVCGVNGKNNARYDVLYIFDKDERSVAERVYGLIRVPEEKKAQMLEACNKVNNGYRWLKFSVDSDNDLNVQADAIINQDTCGPIGVELLIRTMRIIDDVYPEFMHALWS